MLFPAIAITGAHVVVGGRDPSVLSHLMEVCSLTWFLTLCYVQALTPVLGGVVAQPCVSVDHS